MSDVTKRLTSWLEHYDETGLARNVHYYTIQEAREVILALREKLVQQEAKNVVAE